MEKTTGVNMVRAAYTKEKQLLVNVVTAAYTKQST